VICSVFWGTSVLKSSSSSSVIFLTVALSKIIATRKQVRCQRYLLFTYFRAPFWQTDDFTPHNLMPVRGVRVPRPLVWDVSLDKAASKLNHILEVTAVKSLSQSIVLPVCGLHDAQIFHNLFVPLDTTSKPWDLVQGFCSRTAKQRKPMFMRQCEELALLLMRRILKRQFLLSSYNLEVDCPKML